MRTITLVFTLFLSALSATATTLPLNGSYQYRYLGIVPIFNAKLHLPDGYQDATFDPDKPLDLVFNYYRTISKEQLIKQARISLEDGQQTGRIVQFSQELETINNAYRDVTKGDTYRLSYEPDAGTTLYLNEERLVTIEGREFPAFYLSIWLGDDAGDSKISQNLWADIFKKETGPK